MHDKNTMGKREYIVWHIFWGIILLIWNEMFFYRNISQLDEVASRVIFATLYIAGIVLGIRLGYHRRRNGFHILVTLIVPLEIYMMAACFTDWEKQIAWTGIIGLIFAFLYCVMMLGRRIPRRKRRAEVFARRLRYCLLGTRTILAAAYFVLMIGIGISGLAEDATPQTSARMMATVESM